MNILLPTVGRYVVAVSGGVDSIALLHMLQRQPGIRLTVAHLDHGIRDDSVQDRKLVQSAAQDYGLPFVYHEARLGGGASEAVARSARYDFLHTVQNSSGARAIVTAHHQDDVLETAIINLLRGTGRKGLTSLGRQHDIERPLLDVPKEALIAYARDQGLQWREDSTNQNPDYLRNYIRQQILPRFDKAGRTRLQEIIENVQGINHEIDNLILNHLHLQPQAGQVDRTWFTQLPHAVAREVMAGWLRAHSIRAFDSRTLERLVVSAKVGHADKKFDVLQGVSLVIGRDYLALQQPER